MKVQPGFRLCLIVSALAFFATVGLSLKSFGQERVGQVFLRVVPDRNNWTYRTGEPVTFRISAVMDGHPLKNATVTVQAGLEMVPPAIEKTVTLPEEGYALHAGTLREPGFLRCVAEMKVGNRTYRGVGTAGFEPEAIKPTAVDPADFDEFWNGAKEALAKVPVDARLTLLPEYSTSTVNTYHVSLGNWAYSEGQSRFFGILCEPKAEGKYPALLYVPGAGVRPYRGAVQMAEKGIITLQVGIHGIPVNLDQAVYDVLSRGALNGYPIFGLDDRDRYYFKRVYLGCLRANDYLTAHPKWDARNLGVTGGSQGGALSIVVAGMDPRVTALASFYPALSDLTGYLKGRAGGWPHMFRAEGPGAHRSDEKIRTSGYYDVVNFARRIRAEGLYVWGYNDEVCPPTTLYSAFNVIPAAKSLVLALETGHNQLPEEAERVDQWLLEHLTRK